MVLLTPLVLTVTILCAAGSSLAADPAHQGKGKDPVQPPAQQTPQRAPPAPPSKIDPGIHKQPDTVGSPEAVVPPPVVDPDMVVNPEQSRPGMATPPSKPGGTPAPKK